MVGGWKINIYKNEKHIQEINILYEHIPQIVWLYITTLPSTFMA
jgi:hypothetical protein